MIFYTFMRHCGYYRRAHGVDGVDHGPPCDLYRILATTIPIKGGGGVERVYYIEKHYYRS